MNPYNALTANCFWYMVSAEYFSFDFFKRGDPLEVAQRILDKVQELPIQLPTRVLKMSLFKGLLSFETEELVKVGVEMADKLSSMIQPPVHTRNVPLEKKMALTTVAED